MHKKIIFLALLALLLATAMFFWHEKAQTSQYSNVNTVNKVLMQQNQNFNSAKAFQKEGNYKSALQDYQAALPQAQDEDQKGQIEFDIAYMTDLSGDYMASIPMFKTIAANPAYGRVQRAYAVEELGVIYSSYADQQSIAAEIFKDSPYSSFLVDGNLSDAYRKLYEYSAAFYPIGESEVHIAVWYADDLRYRLNAATTTSQGAQELNLIQQSLQKAEADVPRMQGDLAEVGTIPDLYMREALAFADLAAVDAADGSQADEMFQKALATSFASGISANFTNYYYANFLADEYGVKRIDDIKRILSVYSVDNTADIYPDAPRLFGAARTNSNMSAMRNNLLKLSQLDPDFKAYLISLGWHESDFASSQNS